MEIENTISREARTLRVEVDVILTQTRSGWKVALAYEHNKDEICGGGHHTYLNAAILLAFANARGLGYAA